MVDEQVVPVSLFSWLLALFVLGFVMLGLFAFNTPGVTGSIYQMLGHGLSTGGLFLAVGHGHFGMTGGPPSGRLVAQLINQQPTAIAPVPYSPARFG